MKSKFKKFLNINFVLIINFIFLDIVKAETYNNYNPTNLKSCGDNLLTGIPGLIPRVISILYAVIQIAVPVVLVVMGSLDFMKGITASKEDDIKKGQQIFIKRLIIAALVFFVFVIVKIVVGVAAEDNRIMECANCFIRNSCS